MCMDNAKQVQAFAPEIPYLGAPRGGDHPQPPAPSPPASAKTLQVDDDDMPENDGSDMASTTVDTSMGHPPGLPPAPPPAQPPMSPGPPSPWDHSDTAVHVGPARPSMPSPLPTPMPSIPEQMRTRSERRAAHRASGSSAPVLPIDPEPRSSPKRHAPSTSTTVRHERDNRQPVRPVSTNGSEYGTAASSAATVPYPEAVPTAVLSEAASTLPYQDEAHDSDADSEYSYLSRLYPPAILKPWSLFGDYESVCIEQQDYMSSITADATDTHAFLQPAEHGLEMELNHHQVKHFYGLPAIKPGEVLVLAFKAKFKVKGKNPLIEKSLDALTPQEIREHWPAVQASIAAELGAFTDHIVFARRLLAESKNVCSSRWVLRWKMIAGVRAIKARLTIRGFEDRESVNTFASTATRWSQRLVIHVAVQESWTLWIADVATAFLQSDTFQQLAEQEGTVVRDVCLMPPRGYETEFQKVKGLEGMDFTRECLHLLRPAYGLKDAPRAWKVKLNGELLKFGAVPCPH